MSRLELRRYVEKKGGGRTGELTMEKAGRVVRGCSPEEREVVLRLRAERAPTVEELESGIEGAAEVFFSP
jgi:hypothetical protein